MQLLQTAQGPSLASCLSTNSLTKLSLHRFTANSPLRTLVFLRRTMSPDPRVCASDMSHVRGPRQPMWIFASWSDFETDATAISILEPPGPRVQNIYSTFVDQITSSHVTPIEIVLVFPPSTNSALHVSRPEPTVPVGVSSEWISASSWPSTCSIYSSFPWTPSYPG